VPTPPHPASFAHALERDHRVDPAVDALDRWARRLVGDDGARRLLRGAPLGHAAHPLLTDGPVGLFAASTVLDLAGQERAADRLIGLGLVMAVPAAVTGLADWSVSPRTVRRVGAVHAASNALAVSLYGISWLARRRGRRSLGVCTALAAGGVLGVSGYLGGHMAFAQGAPPHDPDAPLAHDEATPGVAQV
jgi:uncharacterized membrane protein